jgi:hypothetical protein
MQYEKEGYCKIPYHLKEVSGISGYTSTGIVHSCLYSDYYETEDETYLSQSEHVTKSIEKLLNNADLFINVLKVPKIYEWHLNVYEYFDTRILCHLKIKRDEAQLARANNPEKYPHIADDIDIRVVAPDCFLLQIRAILSAQSWVKPAETNWRFQESSQPLISWLPKESTAYSNPNYGRRSKPNPWYSTKHIHIKFPREFTPKFVATDEFRANIQKFTGVNDEHLDEYLKRYGDYYSGGLIILDTLKRDNRNVHLHVMSFASFYKLYVFSNSHIKPLAPNFISYRSIFDKLFDELDERFVDVFTRETLSNLKNYFISAWILDGTLMLN